MTQLFSGYGEYRNAAGHLVVELGAPIGFPLIGVLLIPPAGAGMHVAVSSGGPMGTPWFVLWAAIGFSMLGAAFLLLFFAPRSRVRVVVDRSQDRLTVESSSGRAELPLRDVERAEIVAASSPTPDSAETAGTTVTIGDTSATTYRLELVLRSGKRIAATAASFSGYRERDREKALLAIGQELRAGGATAK